MERRDAAALSRRLQRTTFTDLFERLDQKALEDLWDNGRARRALEELVVDPHANSQIRFLAAEILFARLPDYPPYQPIRTLAVIYAAALHETPQSSANAWGLPGRADGQLSRHVMRLGAAAIPALRGLLDDARRVSYEGSQEATLGNSYGFRVKDIAASLIAGIRNMPFVPEKDPTARDNAIHELIRTLGDKEG